MLIILSDQEGVIIKLLPVSGCEVCQELKSKLCEGHFPLVVIEEDLVTLNTQKEKNTKRILKPCFEPVEQRDLHRAWEIFIHTENADLLKDFDEKVEDELMKYFLGYLVGETIEWRQHDKNHVRLSVSARKRYHPQGASAHSPRTVTPIPPSATVPVASKNTSASLTDAEELTLSPRQSQILIQAGEQILLFGPPKTGKTRLLIYVTKAQLDLDVPVLVLSTWDGSLASSKFIQHKAKILTGKEASLIHFILFDDAVAEIVDKAAALARDHQLYVIADEAHDGPAFEKFCNGLHEKIPNVHIWAAASRHKNVPKQMTKELLTEPQGNQAPHIQQLMGRAGFFQDGSTENYTGTVTDASETVTTKMSTRSTVELSQGDPDRLLLHEGIGHDALEPKNCEQCGKDIGTALRELFVDSKEDDGTSKYSFKDVFVLLRRDTDPADTDGQHNGIGVVRGLRSSGIPVRVVGRDDEDGVAEMVTITEKDEGEVTVATILHARGLERKIVVWVGVGEGDYYDVYDKYHATSRAMEKVVWVKAPYEIDFDDAVRNDSDDDEDA